MARTIDADAVLDRYYAEFEKQDICDGSQDRDWLMRCIEEAPTLTPPNEPRVINADKLAKRIAGHSNYHGDSILAAIYCAAEGKENDTPIRSIETPPNELLTVDDLLDMNQTPIWVMDTTVNRGEWCYWKDGRAYSCESHPEYYDLEDYGKWTAYRQPPRE